MLSKLRRAKTNHAAMTIFPLTCYPRRCRPGGQLSFNGGPLHGLSRAHSRQWVGLIGTIFRAYVGPADTISPARECQGVMFFTIVNAYLLTRRLPAPWQSGSKGNWKQSSSFEIIYTGLRTIKSIYLNVGKLANNDART